VDVNRVRKIRSECDDRCQFAASTKDKCTCKCGGEGHGVGWELQGYRHNEKGQLVLVTVSSAKEVEKGKR